MIPESLLALTLSFPASAQERPTTPSGRELLDSIQALRERIQQGSLPTPEELSIGRLSRHEVLSGIDSRAGARFGLERSRMRDRLLPAFTAELRLLEDHRRQRRAGPLPDPSPVLSLVLDFEQELHRNALRRLKSLGLPSPLEVGPLARATGMDDAPEDPLADATDGATDPTTPAAADAPGDPLLLAEMLYAAGRFSAALEEYRKATLPEGERSFEIRYRIADCLLQGGQDTLAIQEFRTLVEAAPGTQWAAQAEWSVAFAEALAALKSSRRRSGPR